LTKNLAKNTIYEEDENLHESNNNTTQRQINQLNLNLNTANQSLNDLNGFVPFMRTNEFLNPAHAGSPVPPSRESSAVKKERERARQVSISIIC
jgi:hypothetical protein